MLISGVQILSLTREKRYTEIREASSKIQNILEENSQLFKVQILLFTKIFDVYAIIAIIAVRECLSMYLRCI